MSAIARSAFRGVRVARFSTSVAVHKSPVETAKDGLKKVDRTISDAAVSGIDAGSNVADKVKKAAGVESGKAQGTAEELAGKAKGAGHELAGKAKGTAEEVKGKMK